MEITRSFSRGPLRAALLVVFVSLVVGMVVAQTTPPPSPGAAARPAAPTAPKGVAAGAAGAADTVASVPSATVPPFPALPALLTDWRGLHPGPAYDAAGAHLVVGHLRMDFRSGTLTAILTASGREAGFVFDGSGYYSYRTEDSSDRQSMSKNMLKFENTSSYRDGVLGEDMKGAILVATSPILPEILGDGAKPSGETPGSAASRITSFLADADEADIGMDHPGAVAALAGSSARTVYAEIRGKSVDPGYIHDPVLAHEENPHLFRTIQGDRFYNIVSHQKIDDGWGASPIVMTHLDYAIDNANNHDADVKIAETFAVRAPFGRMLPLQLLNNADDAATSWKSSKKTIDVRSIKTQDGRELPFSHRYHELLVELPEVPAPGANVTLLFDVSLHSLDTRGDEFYAISGFYGFPVPAWLNSVRATSHWKARTKKPYKAFTGGSILSRREEGSALFYESDSDVPSESPTMIAGKFESKEYDQNGLKVRVNIYGSGQSGAFESYRAWAYTLLGVYGQALSPYPRKELDIMELKRTYVSISMPGMVVVSADFARGRVASIVENRKPGDQIRTFMHELAHQWFGNLVHERDFLADRWISESVAEYLSALVYAAGAKNEKEKARMMDEALKVWWAETDMTKNSVSIASASSLRGDWTTGDDRIMLVYGRGPLVLRTLQAHMGEDNFFKLLETVVKEYADKEISTDEFAKEASAIQGQDMSWFFNQWFREPGVPDLEASSSIVHEGGKTYIAGHLKQRDRARFKILALPFVYTSKRAPATKMVLMDKAEMDFKEEVEPDASGVSLDPARNLLVYYH